MRKWFRAVRRAIVFGDIHEEIMACDAKIIKTQDAVIKANNDLIAAQDNLIATQDKAIKEYRDQLNQSLEIRDTQEKLILNYIKQISLYREPSAWEKDQVLKHITNRKH